MQAAVQEAGAEQTRATGPAAYGNSWYATTMAAAPPRPNLTHDLDVDVCVIGGGLAGLTAAREIARRGWSVAVLEARRIAWNASGRNGGFVLPGFAEDIRRLVERVGLDHAKELWTLSEAGVEYMRTTIGEAAMDGVDPVAGWLDVSKIDRGDELLSIVSLLGQEFGADIEGWPTERVRDTLRTRRYFHAIHYPNAFHVHPLNYALGLARAAEEAGVRIFEDTPALDIDPAGVRKRIGTPAARVRAAQVVLAGNTHLGPLLPEIAGTLLPITTFVAVTAPLGPRLAQAIGYRGAVSDGHGADYHYRIVGGDRLMWGGGVAIRGGNPRRWARRFERAIEALYPQLGTVAMEYAWSGELGRSLHKMPQIGEVSPGLWLASAFGGQGLNTTAMAGELIARAIVEGDDAWRLFSPFDLVWAGGAFARVAVQAIYWSARVGEDITARRARWRDHHGARESGTAAVVDRKPAPDIAADTAAPAVAAEARVEPDDRMFLADVAPPLRPAEREPVAGNEEGPCVVPVADEAPPPAADLDRSPAADILAAVEALGTPHTPREAVAHVVMETREEADAPHRAVADVSEKKEDDAPPAEAAIEQPIADLIAVAQAFGVPAESKAESAVKKPARRRKRKGADQPVPTGDRPPDESA